MRLDERYRNLDRVLQWISNCDAKCSILLTAVGVSLTVVFTSDIADLFAKTIATDVETIKTKEHYNRYIAEYVMLIAYTVFTIFFGYFICRALRGRIDPKQYKQSGMTTESLLFFGAIDKYKYQEFKNKIAQYGIASHLNDLDSQIFINSKIATMKFRNYNRALTFAVLSIAALVAYAIVHRIM